jgi:hypothetical protein
MSPEYNILPDVFCNVVGISKTAGGATVMLACKHTIPALPYRNYRLGDPHICHRCSAKAMSVLLAKAKPDTDT